MSQTLQVMGIGLGRTGTRSLCKAFELLGYDNVSHVPKDFDTMINADAAAEGACMRYRKGLGAIKLILTLRSPMAWVESCKRALQQYPYARHEGTEWQQFVDINRIFRYGWIAKRPDEENIDRKLLTHYFRYNSEVLQQLVTRNLLVMDITAGDGWDKLCPFLDKPIPSSEFPNERDF